MSFTQVSAEGLVKVYGTTRALLGVNLSLPAGCITVVEGENGSGKSTLLGILARLVRPTRGLVRYGERVAGAWPKAALRRQVGVLGHDAMVYLDLTARENLALTAALIGTPAAERRLPELIERFDIGRWGDRPARTYSRGQLQRLALARTLVAAPRLLLLDEPSSGLDARATDVLVEAVKREREGGAIIVLITHSPALAERLADRRIRLARGRVVDDGGHDA